MKLKIRKLMFSLGLTLTFISIPLLSCSKKNKLVLVKEPVLSQNLDEFTNKKIKQIKNEQIKDKLTEKVALEYFESTKIDAFNTSNYNNIEMFKDSMTESFSYLTNFIFFDKEIEEIKFFDLTPIAKKEAIMKYIEIDQIITSMYPDYKEQLMNEYEIINEFFKNLSKIDKEEDLEKFVDAFIENLNEEYYSVKEKTRVYK